MNKIFLFLFFLFPTVALSMNNKILKQRFFLFCNERPTKERFKLISNRVDQLLEKSKLGFTWTITEPGGKTYKREVNYIRELIEGSGKFSNQTYINRFNKIAWLLMKKGCSIDRSGGNARHDLPLLHCCVRAGNAPMARSLMKKNMVDTHSFYGDPISYGIHHQFHVNYRKNRVSILKFLIDSSNEEQRKYIGDDFAAMRYGKHDLLVSILRDAHNQNRFLDKFGNNTFLDKAYKNNWPMSDKYMFPKDLHHNLTEQNYTNLVLKFAK